MSATSTALQVGARQWRSDEAVIPTRSYLGEVGLRLKSDRSAIASGVILITIVAAAIAAPVVTTVDPLRGDVSARLLPIGSAGAPLGTDEQGRDLMARLLYGARLSLLTGIVPVLVATILGTAIGSVAAFSRGFVGASLMRAMDMSYAFPAILLAIAIAAALGAGTTSSIIALSIVFIPPIARVAESATRHVMVQEYMEAARISGASAYRIILEQVLPNVFSPIFIYASSLVGLSIIIASGLSFIGLGSAPPTPEWGAMLNTLRASVYVQPLIVALPGLLIFAVSVAFNMLSNSLRDALDVRHV